MGTVNDGRIVKIYFIVLLILWTLTVGASLTIALRTAENHILTTALAQSRMAMDKDIMYRRWISAKGGFYMPTDVITPNPYLGHVKRRDITTTDGQKLTLVNPAYMTRLVYEFSKDQTHVRTRLVSDRLMNPINTPAGWEVGALKHILRGQQEYYEFDIKGHDKRFNYMAPFIAEKSCLKCHAFQGYKTGDIRGGVSVSSDITDIIAGERNVQKTTAQGYIGLWIIVIGLMTFGYINIKKMLRQMNENQKELNATNAEKETIFRTTFEGIFGTDTMGRVTFVNRSVTENTGYTQKELCGKSHIILTHKRDADGSPQTDNDCLIMQCIKTMKSQNAIETIFRKDGTSFLCDMFIAPVIENNAITGTVVSYYDVTEKMAREKDIKDALAEKSTLLSELNHRVKNNLQIISGIISLQMETAADKSSDVLLKNVQARVMSMALLHETLYKSGNDPEKADITAYIGKLTEYYDCAFGNSAHRIKYVTDIDTLKLSISRVITCGLLINELVTNSIKHAFDNVEDPVISVSLKHDGDNAVLTISDNGNGYDVKSINDDESMGMMLIQSLTEQLYGTMAVHCGKGVTTVVTFPLFI